MTITKIKDAVGRVASSYPVISVDLFGSYANGEAREDSDIDLLVYFDERIANLFDLSGLKLDIQEELHKKVDVVAGPLKENSILDIKKKVRIYEL
jgi:predicted nucleotidyltransferase